MTSSSAAQRHEGDGHRRARSVPSSIASRIERTLTAIPEWVLVGAGCFVYALMILLVLNAGFLEYNADGYTRILRGWRWAQSPGWEVGVWLPLQTWVFGTGLWVYDSLAITPRVIDALLTVWALLNLYRIGREISGRLAGTIGLLLGAVFPWVVWFGVSGMAEALFLATVSAGVLGLVRWTLRRRDCDLLLAAIGLLLSTMVRYEGWFYAAVFAMLVLAMGWRRGQLRPTTLAFAALPMTFPALWMAEHWRVGGDPLGFAYETEAIKESLDAANASAGLLRRLTIYPEETFRLAPVLIALCLLATLFVMVWRVSWWPLIALIAGQGALLVIVSAGFSNLGPGAERYLISNVVLLFPVLGAAVALLPAGVVRLGALLIVIVAGGLVTRTSLNPPTWYPDEDARQVAEIARDSLDTADDSRDPVPVLLPPVPSENFNAGHALLILSDHPEDWFVTDDPALFGRLVAGTTPPFWILDTAVDVQAPTAASTETLGRFLIGYPPPYASLQLERDMLKPGESVSLEASGFATGEGISGWFTSPTDDVVGIDGPIVADAAGRTTIEVVVPPDAVSGLWAMTLTGLESGSMGIVNFTVLSD